MNFKVLYLEDDPDVGSAVVEAVQAQMRRNNEKQESNITIDLVLHKCLDAVPKDLTSFDLVLADVGLPQSLGGLPENRLATVLDMVRERSTLRVPPVIAYTAQGSDVLSECLQFQDRLYDILDRNLQSEEYIAWRLFMVCVELARTHPDATLIRLIWDMPKKTTPWHGCVREMISQYDKGWTESDQVERAGGSVLDIAQRMGVRAACKPLWRSLSRWERLGPATVENERGHARHSLNVFWLGYYLLNSSALKEWFASAWQHSLSQRSFNTTSIADQAPSLALNGCWFYASLFHDAACCMEKCGESLDSHRLTLTPFFDVFNPPAQPVSCEIIAFQDSLISALRIVLDSYADFVVEVAWNTAADGKRTPDHGVAAAAVLTQLLQTDPVLASEAARAIALHNTVPKFCKDGTALNWETDPVSCLLILCDQLVTWDRDDNQHKVSNFDKPRRADLATLRIDGPVSRRTVKMLVDYIAPRHLRRDPDTLYKVERQLKDAIANNPDRALGCIDGWPFDLRVDFSLSGRPLGVSLTYPRRQQ